MSQPFIVIVNFETTPEEQEQAFQAVGDYVGSFLSQQPGFMRGRLHKSNDGLRVLNYAQWESEADFRAFAEKAADHPDLPALRKYSPSAGFFEVWKEY